jgi:hypothetical protein
MSVPVAVVIENATLLFYIRGISVAQTPADATPQVIRKEKN